MFKEEKRRKRRSKLLNIRTVTSWVLFVDLKCNHQKHRPIYFGDSVSVFDFVVGLFLSRELFGHQIFVLFEPSKSSSFTYVSHTNCAENNFAVSIIYGMAQALTFDILHSEYIINALENRWKKTNINSDAWSHISKWLHIDCVSLAHSPMFSRIYFNFSYIYFS